MSGYDWQPEHADEQERAREWDRADNAEALELEVRDDLTRNVGERTVGPFPSGLPRRTCDKCGGWFYSWSAHAERCARGGP